MPEARRAPEVGDDAVAVAAAADTAAERQRGAEDGGSGEGVEELLLPVERGWRVIENEVDLKADPATGTVDYTAVGSTAANSFALWRNIKIDQRRV